jgi:hypothetical protein
MTPTEILAIWQAARAANSATGKALALDLADEHARTHAPRKADAMKPMETIDERRS